MHAFDYAALDGAGKRQTGTVMAATAREARDILRDRRLVPIELTAARTKRKLPQLSLGKKVKHRDLTRATRQLAIMIGASTPVEESLRVTAMQFEKSPLRQILLDCRAQVLEGAKLSDALKAHPRVFPEIYTSMTASGEVSGQLGPVMDRLANNLEAAQKIRGKILGATIYPIVLTVVALLVVIGMLIFLIPRLVQQFESFGQDLPALTKAVIAASEFVQNSGLILLIVLLAMGFGVSRLLKVPSVRLRFDRFLLKVPLLGSLLLGLNAARFARTMAGLSFSGTPMVSALGTAQHTLQNRAMREAAKDATQKVSEGTALSQALRPSGLFPPLLIQMIAGGESSDNLGSMFSKAADYLENEFDSVTTIFLNLLEPLIIIFMAAVVLVIIAAIFLPILQLNTLGF